MLVLWALELVSNYGVHAFGVGKQIPNLFTICWWENGSNVFFYNNVIFTSERFKLCVCSSLVGWVKVDEF